ncbi:MAG: T9SS type A sorting domain-containing protein [Panacibacter sp.]
MKQKYLDLLLAATTICMGSFGQVSIDKQVATGGSKDDFLGSISITANGQIITAGTSYSNKSGEKTENSRGGSDYWIVKHNISGSIEWDKTIGGNDDDFLSTIRQTSDGGYILGGSSYSGISGEKSEISRDHDGTNRGDYWVVKIDANGNKQWDKTIGGGSTDDLTDLQQTTDGGYILGGFSASNATGDKTEDRRGSKAAVDYWIVKISSTGTIEWQKTIGSYSDDLFSSLQQTTDGGYILGGYTDESSATGEKTGLGFGHYDYWIVKVDHLGNIEWDKTIGGINDDCLKSLKQTKDGGYILGGYSSSTTSGLKTQKNRGLSNNTYDFWVVKLDALHNIEWERTFGGNYDDLLYAIEETNDNGYILCGASNSDVSGEKTEGTRGGNDYWIVKIHKGGRIQWDKTIGGFNEEFIQDVKETGKDHFVIAGYSYSGISGDKTVPGRGGADYWLVYLSEEIVLAVNKLNVQAYQQANTVTLKWTNLTEVNIDSYEIQRSADAVHFTSLGNVLPKGNSLKVTSYSFNDVLPLKGYNYYRIKVTDKDGKKTYTKIALTVFTGTLNFTFFPNPAKDIILLRSNGQANISLLNQQGKVLMSKTIEGSGSFNISHLAQGIYYLKNNTTGAVQQLMITK